MNPLHMIASQPWVERLGWTLLHFLWQGALVAAVFAAARLSLAHSRPHARYAAACFALAIMLAAPVATFLWLTPAADDAPPPDVNARVLHFSAKPAGLGIVLPAVALSERPEAWISQAAPWIVVTWALGATLFWVRLAGAWWAIARMRSHHIRPAPPQWQQTFARLCARLRVSRPVTLLVSARMEVPAVAGWLRPIVVVPLGALSGLPPEHVEALLLHELAHIARRDYLVNVMQSIAEALLFYHPAVWWVSNQIRDERELCCDDVAVAASGDAYTYAVALAGLEACRPMHARSVLAATGGKLTARIARLLGQSQPERLQFSRPAAGAAAALLAMTACVLFAQPADRPKFEVASVKPTPAAARSIAGMRPLPGGRLHADNMSVRMLIANAYGVQDYQIAGAPAWLHDEGFDIEAKGAANSGKAQILLMLQSLLADRFQLQLHRETRELPVLALSLTRGGAKLPPPAEGGCMKPDATPPPQAPGANSLPACGSFNIMGAAVGMRMRGGDVSMAELIRQLSMILGRPVLDRTGISRHFDAHLQFTTDEMTAGLMAAWGTVEGHSETMAAAAANTPGAPPNIGVALREQLGLKLDAAKGPVEVLVVDRVERPSGN